MHPVRVLLHRLPLLLVERRQVPGPSGAHAGKPQPSRLDGLVPGPEFVGLAVGWSGQPWDIRKRPEGYVAAAVAIC